MKCPSPPSPVVPFIKWAGGKRWLAPAVAELLSGDRGRHVEPFVGSGACFFRSTAEQALLSDINRELLTSYEVVRDDPGPLIRRLQALAVNRKTFTAIRTSRPSCSTERAARFLYLNRTAFNGLYRVNRNGEFNVPFGCKPRTQSCTPSEIRDCSVRLKRATLLCADFRAVLRLVQKDDRVFLDPPYTVKHNNNAFRRYNEHLFTWADQVDLAVGAAKLAAAAIPVVITNALHADVKALYSSAQFSAFAASRPPS